MHIALGTDGEMERVQEYVQTVREERDLGGQAQSGTEELLELHSSLAGLLTQIDDSGAGAAESATPARRVAANDDSDSDSEDEASRAASMTRHRARASARRASAHTERLATRIEAQSNPRAERSRRAMAREQARLLSKGGLTAAMRQHARAF